MLLGASILLFALCMPMDAVCIEGACHDWQGWSALSLGWYEIAWLGKISPVVSLAWLANPVLLVAWVLLLLRFWRAAAWAGTVATVMALGFSLGTRIVMTDWGGTSPITGHPAGYWVWVLSTAFAAAAGVLGASTWDDGPPRRR